VSGSGGPPDHIIDDRVSRALKKKGMARVIEYAGAFPYEYHQAILAMPVGRVFQNEELRDGWTGTWAKPQAWGACVNAEIKRGLIVQLPQETRMKAIKSHSRTTHWLMRVKPSDDPVAQKVRVRTRGPQGNGAAAAAVEMEVA
jgi:hypothetical protein